MGTIEYAGIVYEVTDLKTAQEKLEEARKRLDGKFYAMVDASFYGGPHNGYAVVKMVKPNHGRKS